MAQQVEKPKKNSPSCVTVRTVARKHTNINAHLKEDNPGSLSRLSQARVFRPDHCNPWRKSLPRIVNRVGETPPKVHRGCNTRLGKGSEAGSKQWVTNPNHRGGKKLTCGRVPKVVEGSERRRILVADEHPLFRHGLQKFFDRQRGLISAGEADSAKSLKAALAIRLPDLLVMDLRFPDACGVDLIKTIRDQYPALPILVLSDLGEMVYAERAMRAGASGFVRKHESLAEVLNAVRCIFDGELYLSRKMSALILHKAFCNKDAGVSSVKALSDRELYVFQLLGAGLTSRKVATQLGVSLKTIHSHRENIKRKLGLRDGAELVRHAVHFVDTPLRA